MSDIYGEGHGSAHDWRYCWSSPSKTSHYQCARCGHKFAHAYDSMPDIFEAMKQQSVPAECQPTTLSQEETETDILLDLQATAGVLFARAATEIERLRKRVAELEAREQRPDPLSQALNEGDGVYRP